MEVVIPENIKDITLEQYQQFNKLIEREGLTDVEFKKRLIAIFTNIKYNNTDKVSKKDFDYLVSSINKAINTDCEFENTFKLNGVTYGFIPNLDKITAKEWFDLQLYPLHETDKLNKLMAILFRPITIKDALKNYKIETYNGTQERAELFKALPMNIVNGATGFFLTLEKQLLKHILKYTKAEQLKETMPQVISKSGDGTRQLTR